MRWEMRASGPDEWRVEGVNEEGEGEVTVVIFSGYRAWARAKEYFAQRRLEADSEQGTLGKDPGGMVELLEKFRP